MVAAYAFKPAPIHNDFEELCMPLRKQLYSKAMQLCRGPAAADLVQDTLLHGLMAWDSFRVMPGEDPNDRASAWMHRILMNQFITGCRRRARREEALETWYDDAVTHTLGEAPAAPGDDRLSQAVQRALADLDAGSRDIIVRIDIHGETYREIQDVLGVSMGTVKSRLHRARRRMADALGRQGLQPPTRP
jgi:RNA polymerase sigma-70 factor (ECF subfamily)